MGAQDSFNGRVLVVDGRVQGSAAILVLEVHIGAIQQKWNRTYIETKFVRIC